MKIVLQMVKPTGTDILDPVNIKYDYLAGEADPTPRGFEFKTPFGTVEVPFGAYLTASKLKDDADLAELPKHIARIN